MSEKGYIPQGLRGCTSRFQTIRVVPVPHPDDFLKTAPAWCVTTITGAVLFSVDADDMSRAANLVNIVGHRPFGKGEEPKS